MESYRSAQPARREIPTKVWDRQTLHAQTGWRLPIPSDVVHECVTQIRRQPERAQSDLKTIGRVCIDGSPALRTFAKAVLSELRHRSGVVHIQGLRAHSLQLSEERALFVAIGERLGRPMQDDGLLTRVREPRAGTTASFGTNSNLRDQLPDFVGWHCERQATQGDGMRLSNALLAHQVLSSEFSASLPLLEQAWIREIDTPDRASLKANRFPIFRVGRRPDDVVFRYTRSRVEGGQERSGAPVDAVVRAAMDRLDEVLARPSHVATVPIEDGDALWIHNSRVAHSRSVHQSSPGAPPRTLWRMRVRTPT